MSSKLTTLTLSSTNAYNTYFCNTADGDILHDTLRTVSRAHQYILSMEDLGLRHGTRLREFMTELEHQPETPGQQAMLSVLGKLLLSLKPISGRIVFASDTPTAPDPHRYGYGRHEIREGR